MPSKGLFHRQREQWTYRSVRESQHAPRHQCRQLRQHRECLGCLLLLLHPLHPLLPQLPQLLRLLHGPVWISLHTGACSPYMSTCMHAFPRWHLADQASRRLIWQCQLSGSLLATMTGVPHLAEQHALRRTQQKVHASKLPQILPGVPAAPAAPGVPAVPLAPGAPAAPGAPLVPACRADQYLSLSQRPSACRASRWTKTPQADEAAQRPGSRVQAAPCSRA